MYLWFKFLLMVETKEEFGIDNASEFLDKAGMGETADKLRKLQSGLTTFKESSEKLASGELNVGEFFSTILTQFASNMKDGFGKNMTMVIADLIADGKLDGLSEEEFGEKLSKLPAGAPEKHYAKHMYKACDLFKLPKTDGFAMLAAIFAHESGWNANAKNPSGATGLGQFMPKTFAEFKRWLASDPNYHGIPKEVIDKGIVATNGDLSVYATAWLVRQNLDFLAGKGLLNGANPASDKRAAVYVYACYNSGPGNAVKMIRYWQTKDRSHLKGLPDWAVKRADSGYIQKIDGKWNAYKRKVGDGDEVKAWV